MMISLGDSFKSVASCDFGPSCSGTQNVCVPCGPGSQLDPVTGHCMMLPHGCPEGFVFDPSNCGCKPTLETSIIQFPALVTGGNLSGGFLIGGLVLLWFLLKG
jgi:hypothetical protein